MTNCLLALAIALVVSGCSSFNFGRVGKDVAAPSTEYSILVLGVSPSDYTLTIFPGQMKDGKFNQDQLKSAAISGPPIDGFVVAQVPAGQTLALLRTYRVNKDGTNIVGSLVGAWGAASTMVFEVPQGKVLHMGDVRYQPVGKRVQVEFGKNFEAAKAYIDSQYPALRGRLEPGTFELVPTTVPCTTTTTVPIYIRR